MKTRNRSCGICVHDKKILLVKMKDPLTNNTFWSPPGGKIEAFETPEMAAARETYEETGYRVRAVSQQVTKSSYLFCWMKNWNICETQWVVCQLAELEPSDISLSRESYITSQGWFELDDAFSKLGHHVLVRDAVFRVLKEIGVCHV